MRQILAIGYLLLGTGCALFSSKAPMREAAGRVAMPDLWRYGGEGMNGQISTGWLAAFADPEMAALVSEALERNQNIRISAMQLEIARDSVVLARGPRLPSLGLGASGNLSGSPFF